MPKPKLFGKTSLKRRRANFHNLQRIRDNRTIRKSEVGPEKCELPSGSDSDANNFEISYFQVDMGKRKETYYKHRKNKGRFTTKTVIAQAEKRLAKKQQEQKNQELCMQIKSSLKLLRRQSKDADPNAATEPVLNLEVYTDEPDHGDDKQANNENETTDFYDETECHDESQPEPNEPKPDDTATNAANNSKQPSQKKPVDMIKKRKNPVRKTILEKQLTTARNAPVVEKVFVNAVTKLYSDNNEEPNSLETEKTTYLDQAEDLYEYGKFIAEQLLSFNQKDTKLAKAEINDVISKYRLKYKILNCLQPNEERTEQSDNNTDREADEELHDESNSEFSPLKKKQKSATKVTQESKSSKNSQKKTTSVTHFSSQVGETGPSYSATDPMPQLNVVPQPVLIQPTILQEMSIMPSLSESGPHYVVVPSKLIPAVQISSCLKTGSTSTVLQGSYMGPTSYVSADGTQTLPMSQVTVSGNMTQDGYSDVVTLQPFAQPEETSECRIHIPESHLVDDPTEEMLIVKCEVDQVDDDTEEVSSEFKVDSEYEM